MDSLAESQRERNNNANSKNNKDHTSDFSQMSSRHESFRYPVRIGDEYDVNILDMSRNGDSGVTRIRGLITFVGGTKPDDKVRIKITKIGKGYARGQLIAYLDSKK
ncbi:MAG TPA: TRAM domain-containing protein [Nitrososphaeraceae archaeon]